MSKSVQSGQRQRGQRGMGSLYQRSSDGRWVAAASRTSPDGRRERRVVTAATREEAMAKLDAVKGDWKKSAPRSRSASLVLGLYMDTWLRRTKARVAPSTFRQREQHVRIHIKPAIGARRLDRLTARHIEEMLDNIVRGGYSARTARHVKATLRVALQDALHDGVISTNPATLAKAPKVKDREQKHLTAEQARQLLRSTSGDELGALWLLAVSTGARAGELCGLSWGDMDLAARQMHVRKQWARGYVGYELRDLKTERSRRVVPLAREVVGVLAEMRERDDEAGRAEDHSPVFHDIAGERLDPTRLAGQLRMALEREGLPVVRMHDLRHTAATLMIGSGIDIVTVSRLLGHSTVTTTLDIYGHADDKQRVEAVTTLGRVLTGS